MKELREVIAVEQFLNTLPTDIRIWVREREPKSGAAAGELADRYLQARKSQALTKARVQQGKRLSNPQEQQDTRRCNRYEIVGHIAFNSRRVSVPAGAGQEKEQPKQERHKDYKRFEGGEKGHIMVNCPKKAMYCKAGVKQLEHHSQSKNKRKVEDDSIRKGRGKGGRRHLVGHRVQPDAR